MRNAITCILFGGEGNSKNPDIQKRKLENGDVFLLLTRGVWEQCPDEKLLEIIRDANEPEEVLYRTEDWILERQETAEIDNYTMAVTFVRKVYQSPKKPWTLKKILMVVIPVVLVVGGISIALFLGHRSIQNKEKELAECMEDGETYFQNDNYQRAVEEYGEAEELADSLKGRKKPCWQTSINRWRSRSSSQMRLLQPGNMRRRRNCTLRQERCHKRRGTSEKTISTAS